MNRRAVLTVVLLHTSACCLLEPDVGVRFTDPSGMCVKVVFPEPWGEMPRRGEIRFRRGDFDEGKALLVAQQFGDARVMSRKKYKIPLDNLSRITRATDSEWARGLDESDWWTQHGEWAIEHRTKSRADQHNLWGGKRSIRGDYSFGVKNKTTRDHRSLFDGTYCGFSMSGDGRYAWVGRDVVALYPGQEEMDFIVVCRLDRLKE
ncbi:MAG: hypothetical protein ACKV22_34065 [Bryobacteraceae bacterium]